MSSLLHINIVHSTSHWVVPRIIIGILVFLGAIIIITEGRARLKKGEPFFGVRQQFFMENYDKIKFWGTIVLFALYIITMDLIGFLFGSILFVFLFNLLYSGLKSKKSILGSVAISVIAPTLVWYIFGVAFNITLPTASLF